MMDDRMKEAINTLRREAEDSLGKPYTVPVMNAQSKLQDLIGSAQAEHEAEVGELVEAVLDIVRFYPIRGTHSIFRILAPYHQIDCPECEGEGLLSTPEASYDEYPDECICDCPTCKGSGKVWRKVVDNQEWRE